MLKKYAATLRPLLHGLPRVEEREDNQYVNTLFEAVHGLDLIEMLDDLWDGKAYYIPRLEGGLEEWSQCNIPKQTPRFLGWWKTASTAHDVWSTLFQQWNDSY